MAHNFISGLIMKILFLNRYFIEGTSGGLVEYLNDLPPALNSLGIETIFYHENPQNKNQLSISKQMQNGMRAWCGPYPKPSWFVSRKKLQPLIDLCHLQKVDLIHAQGLYRSGWLAQQIFQRTDIPYIITSHSDVVKNNSRERMHRPNVQRRCRKILQQAASITHLTPHMEQHSEQLIDTKNKNRIIGNGINLINFIPWKNTPEKNYIFSIGRLINGKGFDILINAYAKLCEQNIKTTLVIAGDGPEYNSLQMQAQTLGLQVMNCEKNIENFPEKTIIFTGQVKGEYKHKLFAESCLTVFPTQPNQWEEAFPIVLLEIMAAGKALIASDLSATQYLMQKGLSAILVKPDEMNAWTDAIKQLIEQPQLRQTMAQNNLIQAENFNWLIIAKQYREVYLSCIPQTGNN